MMLAVVYASLLTDWATTTVNRITKSQIISRFCELTVIGLCHVFKRAGWKALLLRIDLG